MRGDIFRSRPKRELPFRDIVDFATKQRQIHDRFLTYLTSGRGRHDVPSGVFRLLMDRAALRESPIHPLVRIAYAQELLRPLRARAKYQTVLLVTIAPASTVLALDADPMPAVLALRAIAKRALDGFDFVGAIEPALFEGWTQEGSSHRRGYRVSWHVHAMVPIDRPNETKSLIHARCRDLGPMYPGAQPVDARKVAPAHLEGKLSYTLKLPRSCTRLVPKRPKPQNAVENDTELHVPHSFGTRKHALRPKERLLVYCALSAVRISDLWVVSPNWRKGLHSATHRAQATIRRAIEEIDTEHERRGKPTEKA